MLARCRPYFTQQTGGLTRGLTLREIQQAGRKSIKDLSWVEDFRLALSTEDLALTTVRAYCRAALNSWNRALHCSESLESS